MPPLIEVTHPRGIYLPEADLWLDPHFGVKRAFVSHAHSDHVARHDLTFCSEISHQLMVVRKTAKKSGEVVSPKMREVFEWEGWELRLLPAGHITGSAMLHLTRKTDGATLLYTGDYKLRQGLSAERCELMQADTLIMETTFGLPKYRFPPAEDVIAQMLAFVRETLGDGGIPVLLGYSLGKAQEILCALRDVGLPVMVHASVAQITEVLAPHLGSLPDWRLFNAAEAAGHVLVFPPGARMELPKCRTAMLSGWAIQPSAKYRYGVDLALPLSDHADHPELHETVELVKPRRIYLVHGSTREFAAELRALGHDARALGAEDQLELGF
jgi:DNA ligase-1